MATGRESKGTVDHQGKCESSNAAEFAAKTHLRRDDEEPTVPVPPGEDPPPPIEEPPDKPVIAPDAPVREPGPKPARRLALLVA